MWLTEQFEFTDGVVLPVGCEVREADILALPDRYSREDIEAARSCAARLNVDAQGKRSYGKLSFITEIHGCLRVLNRTWTTDVRPAHVEKMWIRTEATKPRPLPAESCGVSVATKTPSLF